MSGIPISFQVYLDLQGTHKNGPYTLNLGLKAISLGILEVQVYLKSRLLEALSLGGPLGHCLLQLIFPLLRRGAGVQQLLLELRL